MNNRDILKSIVKKIVLQEITKADYGTGTASSKADATKELEKAVKSAGGELNDNPLNSKITADDKQGGRKFQIELFEQGEDCYDVTAVYNGSDRKIAKHLSIADAIKFVKDGLEDSKKSYTEKAREKSVNGGKEEKKSTKKEEKPTDSMEETKEKTQVDISDKNDVKADVKPDTKISRLTDETSAQMGGELVDKIEKIIDRVLKSKVKADAKSPFLKADSDKESSDKLTVKDKGTPELKEKKK